MVTKTSESPLSVRDRFLTYCDLLIPIYETRQKYVRVSTLAREMRKAMKDHFKEREEQVLTRLGSVWRAKTEAVERLSRASWITMQLYDNIDEESLLAMLFQPFYFEAGQQGTNHALSQLANMIGRDVIYQGATEWIEKNAIKWGKKYAHSVSETTNQAIRDQISAAIKEGESLDEVRKRISEVYKAATGYRSEMIGRTEMGRTYNVSGATQDARLGIKLFDGCIGCDPGCPICGPFQSSNPHTLDEITAFEDGEVHPNHVGSVLPVVPEGFIPEEQF